MDVRGPTDGQDVPQKVPRVRPELLRDELTDAAQSKSSGVRTDAHDAAPEILRLIQQLKLLPEVRGELVAKAAARLSDGHYSTRESAEKAAEAVLRTLAKD